MAQQALNGLARAAVGIGAGVSLFQASVYNVDGGFRAVMFDRLSGVQRAVRGEGTHFRIPWVQTPHQFDVRIRPRNISSATGTTSTLADSAILKGLRGAVTATRETPARPRAPA